MGKKPHYLSYFFAEDPKILPMVILYLQRALFTLQIYQLNIQRFEQCFSRPKRHCQITIVVTMLGLAVQSYPTLCKSVACQAPLFMGFSRQEYCSRLPCPPPGDLTNPEIKPMSLTLQADSLLSELPGKPKNTGVGSLSLLQRTFPGIDLGSLALQVDSLPAQLPRKPIPQTTIQQSKE